MWEHLVEPSATGGGNSDGGIYAIICGVAISKEVVLVNRTLTPRAMVFISLMGALSFLLMSFEFPLPFAPAYMKFEISDLPALFGGFFLGPLAGTMACLIKILLKLIIIGTHSALVGEMMNLFCSMAFVVTATWYYHFHRTKHGALGALIISSIFASVFAVVTNYYFAIPMYVRLYGIPLDTILKMASAANPFVHSMFGFLLFTVLPFNLIKYAAVSGVTYMVYKRISNTLQALIDRGK
jgi:riboflavin transporter FmnP